MIFPALFLVIGILLPAASAATSSENAALLAFRQGLSGDPLGALSSWVASGDPCRNFSGVSCSADGAVTKVVLHSASLSGTLPTSLSLLPALRVLSLFDNRLSGRIPAVVASLASLRKLNLSRNSFSGPIPASLAAMRLLDLSRNLLSGAIPDDLFSSCARARYVSLSHNSLSGPVPASFSSCPDLLGLDLSSNNLTGAFPAGICAPPRMAVLLLAANSLSGPLGDEPARCRALRTLDLAGNSFDGPAPFSLLSAANMSYFNISFNRFSGEIPAAPRCGDHVEVVDAEGNAVGGTIAGGVLTCTELRVLNLQSNRLVGNIPPDIAQLRSLSVLRLGDNGMVSGEIPPEIAMIDLLVVLDLHGMNLSGAIPPTLADLRFLLELDLSSNHLDGEIPQDDLLNITYLKILDLHGNRLTGGIPSTLGALAGLELLDLSNNSLNGSIPETLGELSRLRSFNLSYNNLTGEIPSAENIQRFGASAFSHNSGLCGAPLENACTAGTRSRRAKLLSVSAIIAIVAAAAIVAGVCLITAVNLWMRRKREVVEGGKEGKEKAAEEDDEEVLVSESLTVTSTGTSIIIGKLVLFSKSLPSRYEDWEAGTKALLDKGSIVGEGSVGMVYKASLEGGIAIAVKKLKTLGRIRSQDEFEQDVGRLGTIRHPNLVQVQGYYWSSTMQLILMEFVPNGNLYQHLHSSGGGAAELPWPRRFSIALGVARALAFLHHDCRPQILHLNIKAANILLDENYEPKLSDHGLVKMLPMLGGHGMSRFHSSAGYVAPELAAQSLSFSDKSDVYSFGIVLIELVTGRKPVERSGNTVVVLCDDVRRLLESGNASSCFDGSLQRYAENELVQVLKLGLICTVDDPSRRPSMAEVVQFLESVKPTRGPGS